MSMRKLILIGVLPIGLLTAGCAGGVSEGARDYDLALPKRSDLPTPEKLAAMSPDQQNAVYAQLENITRIEADRNAAIRRSDYLRGRTVYWGDGEDLAISFLWARELGYATMTVASKSGNSFNGPRQDVVTTFLTDPDGSPRINEATKAPYIISSTHTAESPIGRFVTEQITQFGSALFANTVAAGINAAAQCDSDCGGGIGIYNAPSSLAVSGSESNAGAGAETNVNVNSKMPIM